MPSCIYVCSKSTISKYFKSNMSLTVVAVLVVVVVVVVVTTIQTKTANGRIEINYLRLKLKSIPMCTETFRLCKHCVAFFY